MGNCCGRKDPVNERLDPMTEHSASSHRHLFQDLPPGWKMVPSRSRPGKVSYQNIHTGERISWVPREEAKTFKGGIRRTKKATSSTGGVKVTEYADVGHNNRTIEADKRPTNDSEQNTSAKAIELKRLEQLGKKNGGVKDNKREDVGSRAVVVE